MREMIVGSWRTTLLAVSILLALLMFTQGKITATEFLSILAFFNVAGYLLTKDARSREHRSLAEAPAAPPGRRAWVDEIAYRLLLAFIVFVLGLCFYPLLRDALDGRTTPRTYSPSGGYGTPYGAPYLPSTGQPVPAGAPPADDDEPPHGPTGPGQGLAH